VLGAFRGMEQRGGAGGGTESPGLRDSASPEERGESPASGGPPPCKSSRLEVNGGPATPWIRPNGTQLRALGGQATCTSVVKSPVHTHTQFIDKTATHYLT